MPRVAVQVGSANAHPGWPRSVERQRAIRGSRVPKPHRSWKRLCDGEESAKPHRQPPVPVNCRFRHPRRRPSALHAPHTSARPSPRSRTRSRWLPSRRRVAVAEAEPRSRLHDDLVRSRTGLIGDPELPDDLLVRAPHFDHARRRRVADEDVAVLETLSAVRLDELARSGAPRSRPFRTTRRC